MKVHEPSEQPSVRWVTALNAEACVNGLLARVAVLETACEVAEADAGGLRDLLNLQGVIVEEQRKKILELEDDFGVVKALGGHDGW